MEGAGEQAVNTILTSWRCVIICNNNAALSSSSCTVTCFVWDCCVFSVSWLLQKVFPLIWKWEWGTTENFLYQYTGKFLSLRLISSYDVQTRAWKCFLFFHPYFTDSDMLWFLSCDKFTYCKSIWTEVSAKCPKCNIHTFITLPALWFSRLMVENNRMRSNCCCSVIFMFLQRCCVAILYQIHEAPAADRRRCVAQHTLPSLPRREKRCRPPHYSGLRSRQDFQGANWAFVVTSVCCRLIIKIRQCNARWQERLKYTLKSWTHLFKPWIKMLWMSSSL